MQSKTLVENGKLTGGVKARLKAYVELTKVRLTIFVAFSAVFGFSMAAGPLASWTQLLIVGLAGFMITGGANALNQLFEKELDAKMKRTQTRPLPEARLHPTETLVFALLMGGLGVAMLGYFFNLPSALLGIIGLLSYAFVYTPMKQMSPFAVFVGAIPGALPPLIGWVAFTGAISTVGWLLFAFQFFWQFPHFWAIAWLLDEDYQGSRLSYASHLKWPVPLKCSSGIGAIPYVPGPNGIFSLADGIAFPLGSDWPGRTGTFCLRYLPGDFFASLRI